MNAQHSPLPAHDWPLPCLPCAPPKLRQGQLDWAMLFLAFLADLTCLYIRPRRAAFIRGPAQTYFRTASFATQVGVGGCVHRCNRPRSETPSDLTRSATHRHPFCSIQAGVGGDSFPPLFLSALPPRHVLVISWPTSLATSSPKLLVCAFCLSSYVTAAMDRSCGQRARGSQAIVESGPGNVLAQQRTFARTSRRRTIKLGSAACPGCSGKIFLDTAFGAL